MLIQGESRSDLFHSPARSIRLLFLILLAWALTSCGGGSSSSTVAVTITPATTTLSVSQTASFVATVSGTKNTAVTWSVNGIAGGNSTYGTISNSGVYLAPSTVTSTISETITATSSADTTKSASATVTLTTSGGSTSSSVTVSPSYVVLPAGAQQTFTATLGVSAADVTWTVSCKSSVTTDCGIISSGGVYTAPLAPPPGGNASITATTKDGSASPGYSTIALQYSNGTLAGRYSFSFFGAQGAGSVAAIGSVVLDGAGNISSGVLDVPASPASTSITGGTYHVGTDGRGTATVQTVNGSRSWQFVVVNHARGYATATDSGGDTMTGTLDLQNSSQFLIGVFQGNYALQLNGSTGSASEILAEAGAITADGQGHISSGLVDVNSPNGAQVALAATGTYTAPSSEGRGTATLTSSFGTQALVYYIVDGTHLKLLEQSSSRAVVGEIVKQSVGPFAASNFKGSYATALYGWSSGGPASFGAQLSLDGAGGASAIIASNANGNVQSGVTATGSYTVTDTVTGRAQLALTDNGNTRNFILYPAANQDLYIVETDQNVAGGSVFSQTGFVVTLGSLAGNFATRLFGTNLSGTSGFEAVTGQTVVNGGGAISGTLDLAFNGSNYVSTALSGSYFVDTNSVVSVTLSTSVSALNTGTWILYPIDAQRFLLIESDSNRVATAMGEVHN